MEPEVVGEVLRVLRDLATQTKATLLPAAHPAGSGREIADRVVTLRRGRVVEEAPPAQILSEPREGRTATFLRAVLGEE